MVTAQCVSFCILLVPNLNCITQIIITRDILDFVIYSNYYSYSMFKQKLEYLGNERRSFKKEFPILTHNPHIIIGLKGNL